MIADIKVALPHPRQRKSDEFQAMVDQVYSTLAGQTRSEQEELGTAPGEPGRTRRLPEISIDDLAGLLENLAETPGNKQDIYILEGELAIDADQLLQLTETAELLGFATIKKATSPLPHWGRLLQRPASWRAKKSLLPASAAYR